MNEKKKYEKPVAEVMDFAKEDIIVTSLTNGGTLNGFDSGDGEDWGGNN